MKKAFLRRTGASKKDDIHGDNSHDNGTGSSSFIPSSSGSKQKKQTNPNLVRSCVVFLRYRRWRKETFLLIAVAVTVATMFFPVSFMTPRSTGAVASKGDDKDVFVGGVSNSGSTTAKSINVATIAKSKSTMRRIGTTSTSSKTSNNSAPEVNSFQPKPRYVQAFFDLQHQRRPSATKNVILESVKRIQPPPERDLKIIPRSRVVVSTAPHDHYSIKEKPDENGCILQHDWQKEFHENCNSLHEIDWRVRGGGDEVKLVGTGNVRDVWLFRHDEWNVGGDDGGRGSKSRLPFFFVMKQMRGLKSRLRYTSEYRERLRREAVSLDRLTSSPLVSNMYAYCAYSGLFEFSAGGSIDDVVRRRQKSKTNPMPQDEKLEIAYQVASAVAQVHTVDDDEKGGGRRRPSLVHGDIKPSNFLLTNGVYKLNDFDRTQLLKWNPQTGKVCGFNIAKNPSKYRSPEEYKYEVETEKIDVYSMGNIMYILLTNKDPFRATNSQEEDAVQALIKKGGSKLFPPELDTVAPPSDGDPIDIILRKAMKMCYTYDPILRPSAGEVANFIHAEREKLGASP